MKKSKILSQTTRVAEVMSYDDLYDEISSDLDLKIDKFQKRRWRELRRSSSTLRAGRDR